MRLDPAAGLETTGMPGQTGQGMLEKLERAGAGMLERAGAGMLERVGQGCCSGQERGCWSPRCACSELAWTSAGRGGGARAGSGAVAEAAGAAAASPRAGLANSSSLPLSSPLSPLPLQRWQPRGCTRTRPWRR